MEHRFFLSHIRDEKNIISLIPIPSLKFTSFSYLLVKIMQAIFPTRVTQKMEVALPTDPMSVELVNGQRPCSGRFSQSCASYSRPFPVLTPLHFEVSSSNSLAFHGLPLTCVIFLTMECKSPYLKTFFKFSSIGYVSLQMFMVQNNSQQKPIIYSKQLLFEIET